MLEDYKLQLSDVVWMYPVFGGLSYEVLLATASSTITLDWVTTRPNQIVESRECDDESVVVVLEKWLGL